MPNASVVGIRKLRHASDANFGTLSGSKNGQVVTYESSTDSFVLAAVSGGEGGTNDHSALLNLSYAGSGHTGFAGTGVANTFSQLQTFGAGVTVSSGGASVTGAITATSNISSGGNVVATGNLTGASVISPLLTSASNVDVTINPGGTGNVLIPQDTPLRTDDFDSSFPIQGYRMGPTGTDGVSSLVIGEIAADTISTKVFVADETRVDRANQYWTRSYGILAEDLVTPASYGAGAIVTFEDSAALVGAIAADNYWVLFRRAEIDTGLDMYQAWGQLVGYTDNGDGTQSFSFVLRAGNFNTLFPKGATGVIFGASGDAVVHLSAADSAGAPSIKMRRWVTNPTVPNNYTTYVQIGALAGHGNPNYSPTGYGFYARPGSSANQFVSIDTNGFQIRGADFKMFNSSLQTVDIASSNGSLKLGTNIANSNTTGFAFDGATGDITIGGGSYSPTVTVYGQMVIKAGSSGYANISGIPTSLSDVNSSEGTKLSGIAAGATVGATWGTNLNSIPTRFGSAPSSAGLYLTATHMGYYDGSAWKAWIASNGYFYFGGSSGAHLEWNGSKLRGIGTDGTTEKWYASSSDGTLGAGNGAVWMDQNGYNVAITEFGDPDYIRFSRGGVLGASIGYQRDTGSLIPTDGLQFNVYQGGWAYFNGGIGIKTNGKIEADASIQCFSTLTGNGVYAFRPPGTDPNYPSLLAFGSTHHSYFAQGSSEDTTIRGGKTGSKVVLNDTSGLGDVIVGGASGAKLGIGGSPSNMLSVYIGNKGMHVNPDNGGSAYLFAYDGGASQYMPMVVRGSTFELQTGTTPGLHTSINNTSGLAVFGASTETARGSDNVRMGVIGGDPRIMLENATYTQWGITNTNGFFRLITPGVVRMEIDSSTGNTHIGGAAPGTYNWKLNVLSSTYQVSINPGHGGTTNYISSYNGASDAPLALYGSRVFVDGTTFGIGTTKTPTSSADSSGSTGDFAWDTGYVYVKTGPGAWKRAALSTF